jgi:hypothetical protein
MAREWVPGEAWDERVGPSDAWDLERLREVRRYCDQIGTAALFVATGGRVLAEVGDVDRRFIVQSARKSVLSALYGRLWADDRVQLDATLAELGVDDLTPLTSEEKQATVEHLLQSRSGVYLPAAAEYTGIDADRPVRGSAPPGSRYWYNNWDFNTAGTIFEQLAGLSVFEAAAAWLAKPLGMQDFRVEDGRHFFIPASRHAAYHMVMTARDLARFGLLFARGGRWNDTQVLPAEWVERSTAPHSMDVAEGFDYGYMWWVGKPADLDGHRWFAARGGGHAAWVVPSLDLVVVHRNMGITRTPSWEQVAPVLGMIVDAHAKATPTAVGARRPVVPGRASDVDADGWLQVEAPESGVALRVPPGWRRSDTLAGNPGERVRFSLEDGWNRQIITLTRRPWPSGDQRPSRLRSTASSPKPALKRG